MNLTIEAPAGSTTHGNPRLLCVPPKAINYVIFYVANYFAHAASVVIEPGQSLTTIIYDMFMALLLPGSGIVRALSAIIRCANWEYKNDGQRAARAGAFCMVVRKTENQNPLLSFLVGFPGEFGILNRSKYPQDPEHELAPIRAGQTWNYEKGLEIPKGYYYMPEWSSFATLQLTLAENVEGSSESQNPKPVIASSISFVRPLIGLVQAVWGAITLYRARGNQVDQYGYAAFGLTVAPYVMMSVLNALGNILTPVYPSMFLIKTTLLEEVQEQKIASFSGLVNAKFDTTETIEFNFYFRRIRRFIAGLDNSLISPVVTLFWDMDYSASGIKFSGLGLLLGLVPLAVIGSISGFQNGNSTAMERGFTMSWLVVGLIYGLTLGSQTSRVGLASHLEDAALGRSSVHFFVFPGLFILQQLVLVGPPAIGGMVMVGKMIKSFGICTLIT